MGQSVRNERCLVMYACLFLRAIPSFLIIRRFDALFDFGRLLSNFFVLRLDGAPYGRGVAILLPYVFRVYIALIIIVHCS